MLTWLVYWISVLAQHSSQVLHLNQSDQWELKAVSSLSLVLRRKAPKRKWLQYIKLTLLSLAAVDLYQTTENITLRGTSSSAEVLLSWTLFLGRRSPHLRLMFGISFWGRPFSVAGLIAGLLFMFSEDSESFNLPENVLFSAHKRSCNIINCLCCAEIKLMFIANRI